jgi:hypothetical protein
MRINSEPIFSVSSVSLRPFPLTLRWPAATEHLALIAGQWRRVGEEYEATYRRRAELLFSLAVMVDNVEEFINGL